MQPGSACHHVSPPPQHSYQKEGEWSRGMEGQAHREYGHSSVRISNSLYSELIEDDGI